MTEDTQGECREIIRPITIFCDIDGTLLRHYGSTMGVAMTGAGVEILPGVRDKIEEWDLKGYNIILVTGRRESMRSITEKQLSKFGIVYDQLVMGIGGGDRYLINDTKPNCSKTTCFGITVERNGGIEGVGV